MKIAAFVLVLILTAACTQQRRDKAPTPPPPAGDNSTVNGTERIGWDQDLSPDTNVGNYSFVAYVDEEVRSVMSDATCTPSGGSPGWATCSAALPPMRPGSHVLRIAAIRRVAGTVREGDKSLPLALTMLGSETPSVSGASVAAGSVKPDWQAAIEVEILSRDVTDVTDVAVDPDGRVLVAERRGVVRIFQQGALLEEPALVLSDIVADSEGYGLLSVALHPDFVKQRRVFFAYTAPTRDGAVYRIASGREVGGRIGEVMTLLTAGPAADGGSAVIRVGPDRKLYAALSEGEPSAGIAASGGRIVRLNEDGSTPPDSPRFSPVVVTTDGVLYGLEWSSGGDALYAVTSAHGGRELTLVAGPETPNRKPLMIWPAPERPTTLARYGDSVIAPFAERLLVARLDGGLQAVDVSNAAPGRPPLRVAEGLGAVSAVAVASDGSVYLGTANRRRVQPSLAPDTTTDLLVRIGKSKSKGR